MTPFTQFEIKLISENSSNIILIIAVCVLILALLKSMILYRDYIISNIYIEISKEVYQFVLGLLKDQASKIGEKYFGLVISIFLYVLLLNILGLIPYGFAVTGQLAVTLILAFAIFIGLIIIGVGNLKQEFLKIFIPKDVEKVLLPLMICIEILSFLIRPVSLSVRLFANILAGHILLYIISNAVVLFMLLGIMTALFSVFPFIILMAFIILEIGVALLQAYVFTILVCIYLRDCLESHG